MIDDILSIPGNPGAYQRLLALLKSQKAVAFVGAGASAGLYPMWEDLIGQLAKRAGDNDRASDAFVEYWKAEANTDPLESMESIARRLDGGPFLDALNEIFEPRVDDDGRRFTATHERLLRLPFRGFLTTNYDLCLSEARSEICGVHTPPPFTWRSDQVIAWDQLARPEIPPILHAHGMWGERKSFALTASKYREAYQRGPWAKRYEELRDLLFDLRETEDRDVATARDLSHACLGHSAIRKKSDPRITEAKTDEDQLPAPPELSKRDCNSRMSRYPAVSATPAGRLA